MRWQPPSVFKKLHFFTKMVRGRLGFGWLAMALVAASAASAMAAPDLDEARFFDDLRRLTEFPHRLPGSEYGAQAVDYIEERLRAVGIDEIYRYHMEVPYLRVDRCELQIGGRTIPLSPLRPNLTVPPVTPEDGVEAPLLYVGRGELEDYGTRSPEGAIVLMDYDSFDNWQQAFVLGAKAVIFLGDGRETPVKPLHLPIPVNLLRMYAERADFSEFALEGLDETATLHSQVTWEYRWDVNLVARVAGTDPTLGGTAQEPESLVLSAAYDSFGEVPHRVEGARRAANVAALLGAAESFSRQPVERNVILMFLGGGSYNLQGAREVYDALLMDNATHRQLAEEYREEARTIRQAYDLLVQQGLLFDRDAEGAGVLRVILRDRAQFARDDISLQLQLLRLEHYHDRDDDFRRREQRKVDTNLQWDTIRRAVHDRRLGELVEQHRQYASGVFETAEAMLWNEEQRQNAAEDARNLVQLFDQLIEATREQVETRLFELEYLLRSAEEREALRTGLIEAASSADAIAGARAIPLHVSFNLSDRGPEWGFVPGNHLHQLFDRSLPADSDSPGYYVRILGAFRDAAETLGGVPGLSQRSLRDPMYGATFVPGLVLSEGSVAGAYGVYNLALTTGFDRRLRDGHPADTVDNLDGRRILEQARKGVALLRVVAGGSAVSQPRVFSPKMTSKYPGWRGGRSWGELATMQVVGGLAETRPAVGALMALWPAGAGTGGAAWDNLQDANAIADFSPFALERVDVNGRFRILGARRDLNQNYMMLGTRFDERGEVESIASADTIRTLLTATARVSLFPATGGVIGHRPIHRTMPQSMRLVKGSTNGAFRNQEVLWGTLGNFSFAHISIKNVGDTLKFFQPLGPVVLGEFTPDRPSGFGFPPQALRFPPRTSAFTYDDLWRLNEGRLRTMRTRGVSRIDLEILHGSALASSMQLEVVEDVATQESLKQSSASLSHRLYGPLLGSLDDLVHAIVVLLLLSIPFAFAMERLAICATSIYGRIGGFVLMFGITFGLLYWMHPGFAISATPMIIFLAFAILLLSSLVIYILLRKFDTELKALQGQSLGLHDVEVSRTGTMLAAVGMGMSTMRRRPTRTILSAVTVVILTFTILCFASFTRNVGVRAVYEGPVGEDMPVSVLAHNIDYSALPAGVPDLLRRHAGEDGLLATQWWMVRMAENDPPLTAVNPHTGASVDVEAALGITPEELNFWPALADCIAGEENREKIENLKQGKLYLPQIMVDLLGLEPGDELLINGHSAILAGSTQSANLQSLRNVDSRPVVPVDFRDVGPDAVQADEQDDTSGGLIAQGDVDRNFTRLSSEQVVVGSAELVRELGGDPHVVNLYPGADVDIAEKGRELAQLLSMPVWAAGVNGVERMILTILTEVAGGLALAVPLLLGGFIIFGTLLGSISDREKEIYTFSALGLSPGHVGMLFFAEAVVYAVVGGMGGQLLAQATALIASALAERGIIQPVSINFSSTNSLFAIGVVMAVVLVSAIYPAICASKSANPGLARSWRMPPPEGDILSMTFPFTVSAYDITGVVSFLAEHFRTHDDAGLGNFAASQVGIKRNAKGYLELSTNLALAPFDLGVTQHLMLTAVPSEIEGVDEVVIRINRLSGANGDWLRGNRVFIRDLRVQFLVWRTLSAEAIEDYRIKTLKTLGETVPSEASA